MPIYEYKCPICNHRFSVLQRLGEGNEHLHCEKCGEPKPVKQFSTFASSVSSKRVSTISGAPSGGFT
jgi:putative FmdB family regulatory protein